MQLYTIHHINVSDVAIAVGVGIGAPCITICVIAVLLYRRKNRHRLDTFTSFMI